MADYYYKNKEFIIEDFDQKKEFTSFLPAIAGKNGIPLWCFYVNRGQCVTSFGVKDKNGAILEFFPAYTAYEVINRIGFRTFIKINGRGVECFSTELRNCKRSMYIKKEEFSIIEENPEYGYKIKITYYTLPNEKLAGLMRKVEIANTSNNEVEIEVLDGISQVFSAGTSHLGYKIMSNIQRCFMEAEIDKGFAYFKSTSKTTDSVETLISKEGNFCLSFIDDKKLITPIVDACVVFGYDSSYSVPLRFYDMPLSEMLKKESAPYNKVPCAFVPFSKRLAQNETVCLHTIIGNAKKIEAVEALIDTMANGEYFARKEAENTELIENLTKDVLTDTANDVFDAYIESTYLDNFLRGGYPFVFADDKGEKHVTYLFSRRHGDPERDYNSFLISDEYYSQGSGHFRDICQNRRNDSMFCREVKDVNLKYFLNLIQLDGYNPVMVNGTTLEIEDKSVVREVAEYCFYDENDVMYKLLSGSFTLGKIVNTVMLYDVKEKISEPQYLSHILTYCKNNIEADYFGGYWSDHFNYLMDLYDSYMGVYPDNEKAALFDDTSYGFYESVCSVKPRNEKYVLTADNKVRQYGALEEKDQFKIDALKLKANAVNFANTSGGKPILTNLFSKFFALAFLKFNLLDNEQLGIEMEAERPGWNDACTGLPGLFGSGMTETMELVRIVRMLEKATSDYPTEKMTLPCELLRFERENMRLASLLESGELSSFDYWDKTAKLREAYRQNIRSGLEKTESVELEALYDDISLMEIILDKSVERAFEIGNGIIPTYFRYEATDYELIKNDDGSAKRGYNGLPLVRVNGFRRVDVKKFLESPACAYKVVSDKDKLKTMYRKIRASEIFDTVLNTYKTSEPLDDETFEIGRIKAFTAGWQEREANFMHMSYKYLLGLLKCGLYDEFYSDCENCLVCNMNPEVYGRSILEHSSFVASSRNPDKDVVGRGFITRLSGSTSEMLNMYLYMMTGGKPFVFTDGELKLDFKPKLKSSFFKKDNTLSFTFMKDVLVTYVNEYKTDTFDMKAALYTLKNKDESVTVKEVKGDIAEKVRDGKFSEIIVSLAPNGDK